MEALPGAGARVTVLVGRSREQAALLNALARVAGGRGGLVLIDGDAGIGKTSLARAIGNQARQAGLVCAAGACYERDGAPSFAPWLDLLAELRSQAAIEPTDFPAPFGSASSPHTAYQLLQLAAAALHRAATARPLVLLLDDLHWADQDSLDLLEFATRRIEERALLIVATYRPAEVHRLHPLYGFLPKLVHDCPVETLHLNEFSMMDTTRFVEARLDHCTPALADYLHRRSEGNPLFLAELLRDLRERNLLQQDERGRWLPPARTVEVPVLLQQIISRRSARLGADVAELLDVAAIVGEEWRLPVVEAVLGWPEAALLAAVEAALAAAIIARVDESAELYRFSHALIREVRYSQQHVRRRRELHARVAAALAAPGQAVAPDVLAHHHTAAERWDLAAHYGMAAGDAAWERFALHGALRSYEEALAAAERLAAAVPTLLVALHVRIARARMALSRVEQAEADYLRLLAVAQASGDQLAAAEALIWLGIVRTRLNRLQDALSSGEEGLAAAKALGDQRLLSLAHWNVAHIHLVAIDLDRITPHDTLAVTLAREGGHTELLGWCLQVQAIVAVWRGEYGLAERLGAEALALAYASHDAYSVDGACFRLGLARGEHGNYGQALAVLREGLAYSDESGVRRNLPRLLNTLGWVHSELGDLEQARHWDERALEVARGSGNPAIAEAWHYSMLNLAADALHVGDPDAAERHLSEVERRLEPGGYGRLRYLNRYYLARFELALARREYAVALRWAEQAEALAAAKGMRKNTLKSLLLRGRVHLDSDRPTEAVALLRQAVAMADELEHGSLRWQARSWLGRACTAANQPLAAQESYRQADERIVAIAAALPDDRLRDCFLASPAVRHVRDAMNQPVPSAAESGHGSLYPAGLSAREVTVLRLIAAGQSNRQIAAALFLSERTVHSHVRHILTKTGATNRASATAFAFQHGLA